MSARTSFETTMPESEARELLKGTLEHKTSTEASPDEPWQTPDRTNTTVEGLRDLQQPSGASDGALTPENGVRSPTDGLKGEEDLNGEESMKMESFRGSETDDTADILKARESEIDEMTKEIASSEASRFIDSQVQEHESALASAGDDAIPADQRSDLIMRLFGTSAFLHKDSSLDDGQLHYPSFIIHPYSLTRSRWDLFVILITVYNVVVLPVRLCFSPYGESQEEAALQLSDPLIWIDLLLDLLLCVDLGLNFITGYDDLGQMQMEPTQVRAHYLQTAFGVDLVASVPLDFLLLASGLDESRLVLRVRMSRWLKLLRLPRMFRYLSRWEDKLPFSAASVRLQKLIFIILLFAHLDACLQFYAAKTQDFPDDTWVVKSDILYARLSTQYLRSLFNALSHMLCIGYGEEFPATIVDIWITMVSMVIGASMYVLMVGMMASLIMGMDQAGASYFEKMDVWKQYFVYRGLPRDLRNRITKFYEQKWHTRKAFDEQAMLGELSSGLRTDISMHMCSDLVRQVPIFRICSPQCVYNVIPLLKPMSVCPWELIYREEEIANELFFLLRGEVRIETSEGDTLTQLSHGSYFGEFPLIYKETIKTRTANARAVTKVELYVMVREDFEQICTFFPEIKELMTQIADARMNVNWDDVNRNREEAEGSDEEADVEARIRRESNVSSKDGETYDRHASMRKSNISGQPRVVSGTSVDAQMQILAQHDKYGRLSMLRTTLEEQKAKEKVEQDERSRRSSGQESSPSASASVPRLLRRLSGRESGGDTRRSSMAPRLSHSNSSSALDVPKDLLSSLSSTLSSSSFRRSNSRPTSRVEPVVQRRAYGRSSEPYTIENLTTPPADGGFRRPKSTSYTDKGPRQLSDGGKAPRQMSTDGGKAPRQMSDGVEDQEKRVRRMSNPHHNILCIQDGRDKDRRISRVSYSSTSSYTAVDQRPSASASSPSAATLRKTGSFTQPGRRVSTKIHPSELPNADNADDDPSTPDASKPSVPDL